MLTQTVQLLKSWEYKNADSARPEHVAVVQLLKSWEYKNKSALETILQKRCTVT